MQPRYFGGSFFGLFVGFERNDDPGKQVEYDAWPREQTDDNQPDAYNGSVDIKECCQPAADTGDFTVSS